MKRKRLTFLSVLWQACGENEHFHHSDIESLDFIIITIILETHMYIYRLYRDFCIIEEIGNGVRFSYALTHLRNVYAFAVSEI